MNEVAGDIKLSCRRVWKVYAEDAAPYFKSEVEGADATGLSARMREDGAIPAAVDVSFDVHVGEIFVIMGLSGSGKSTVANALMVKLLEDGSRPVTLLDTRNDYEKEVFNGDMGRITRVTADAKVVAQPSPHVPMLVLGDFGGSAPELEDAIFQAAIDAGAPCRGRGVRRRCAL